MKKKKNTPAKPRINKFDVAGNEFASGFGHANTAVIQSQMRLCRAEVLEYDRAITSLSAALTSAREQRTTAEAKLRSLTVLIDKRR